VFQVDRRIYRVDRWAVPVPGGVPLLGVGYFVGALLVLLLAAHLPAVGGVVVGLSPPLRFVVLPLAVAVLGLQAAPDGRVAHRFARDWLALRLRTRRRSAGRTVPLESEPVGWRGEVATRWDEHAPALHGARVVGPARVTFAVPVAISQARGRVVARAREDGVAGDSVVVCARQVLEVRS
jgi:hypothetical protein